MEDIIDFCTVYVKCFPVLTEFIRRFSNFHSNHLRVTPVQQFPRIQVSYDVDFSVLQWITVSSPYTFSFLSELLFTFLSKLPQAKILVSLLYTFTFLSKLPLTRIPVSLLYTFAFLSNLPLTLILFLCFSSPKLSRQSKLRFQQY